MNTNNTSAMIKIICTVLLFLCVFPVSLSAQVAINEDDTDPDANAALDVKADGAANPKGVLIPNLSETQRNNLPSPADGLMIFNRTTGYLNYYNGTNWMRINRTAGDNGSADNTGAANNDEVGVGIGIEDPYNCALLHINSNNKGLLLPRFSAPAGSTTGLIYYDTDDNKIKIYDGSGWETLDATSQAAANTGTGTASGTIIGTGTVDQSAKLEIKSADKGLLIPRLTTAQRDDINEVTEGLIIYNTTDNEIQFYVDSKWYSCDFE